MSGETWRFTDEDKARLQPLLEQMRFSADYATVRICQMAATVEDRLLLLQGVCEELAARMREQIFEQADRGEWAERGITKRDDIDVAVEVNAFNAYHNNGNLVHLSIVPTRNLS